jgi:hypothetical protein
MLVPDSCGTPQLLRLLPVDATVAFTLQVYFQPSQETAAPLAASIEATLGSALGAL